MRLIDADELMHRMETVEMFGLKGLMKVAKEMVVVSPTVDPVKHGHWIEAKYPLFTCSECGATYQDIGYGYNFCPNCGAKMDEVRDDNA